MENYEVPITMLHANLTESILLFPNINSTFNSVFNISLCELSLIPEFFLGFIAIVIITHCSVIACRKIYNQILLQFSITSLYILIILSTSNILLNDGSTTIKCFSLDFSFLSSSLGFFSKIITIFVSLLCLYLIQDYIIEYKINNTEYSLLMLYAIVGLVFLIEANDFGTIFLALELQSLSLFILSKFKKNSIYSAESGLKYFLLGALSAAYFLLGWSLLYCISGLFILLNSHLFFGVIKKNYKSNQGINTEKETNVLNLVRQTGSYYSVINNKTEDLIKTEEIVTINKETVAVALESIIRRFQNDSIDYLPHVTDKFCQDSFLEAAAFFIQTMDYAGRPLDVQVAGVEKPTFRSRWELYSNSEKQQKTVNCGVKAYMFFNWLCYDQLLLDHEEKAIFFVSVRILTAYILKNYAPGDKRNGSLKFVQEADCSEERVLSALNTILVNNAQLP